MHAFSSRPPSCLVSRSFYGAADFSLFFACPFAEGKGDLTRFYRLCRGFSNGFKVHIFTFGSSVAFFFSFLSVRERERREIGSHAKYQLSRGMRFCNFAPPLLVIVRVLKQELLIVIDWFVGFWFRVTGLKFIYLLLVQVLRFSFFFLSVRERERREIGSHAKYQLSRGMRFCNFAPPLLVIVRVLKQELLIVIDWFVGFRFRVSRLLRSGRLGDDCVTVQSEDELAMRHVRRRFHK